MYYLLYIKIQTYGEVYMKYIIDMPKWLDIKIKRILANEATDYSSIEDFIVVACENQIKLEDMEGAIGLTDVGSKVIEAPDRTERTEHFLNLLTSDITACPTVELPASEKLESVLLWGQIYRIFPIKLGARVLANMIKESGTAHIKLGDFREVAADVARKYGLKLKKLDERLNRKLGEKYSTGLPIGKNAELSKNRYKAHYLAYQTGKKTFTGALADLRLISIEGGKIGITEKGLKFAQLTNPLLDIKEPVPSATLSVEESEHYLSLTNEFLPRETAFMKAVLSMIEKGEPPREEFNAKVKEDLESTWEKEITSAVANTMRSGVLSRMWELGLVESTRIGKTVCYKITEKGRRFLHGEGGD